MGKLWKIKAQRIIFLDWTQIAQEIRVRIEKWDSINLKTCQAPVAYICIPSYSGGRDQKDCVLKAAQADSSMRKHCSQKGASGVAQGVGPEFKPPKTKTKQKTTFCMSKETIARVKRQPTEWEKNLHQLFTKSRVNIQNI
jgi:hypothetical protein